MGIDKDLLEKYFDRKLQSEEEHLREGLRSLCDYVGMVTGKYSSYRAKHDIGRSRPETEFERRAVYDIMHGVGGQKDWPGW